MNEKTDCVASMSHSHCKVFVQGQFASGKSSLIEVMNRSHNAGQFIELIEFASEHDATEEKNCIWYCVDGAAGLSLDDMPFIKDADTKTLIVITKSELLSRDQDKMLRDLLGEYISPERIVAVSAKEKIGLDRLLEKTHDICLESSADSSQFEAWWNEFCEPVNEDFRRNTSAEADSYINWAAGRAAAIALVPLPLSDAVPLIANEIHLIHKLASIYGMSADKSTVTTIMGCVGGSLIGKLAAGFLPVAKIPVAAGVTYGIGKAAKAYFESGKTIDANTLSNCFHNAVREAKEMVWRNKVSPDGGPEVD